MIYRLCRRCKKVIGYNESYCSKCLPIIEEQRNEYKKKRENNLIRLAKKTAREVAHTKIPVKLEAMNSYERRIIHTALVDYSKVTTVSEGEEPNRCVVIKPVEEEN